MRKLIVCNMMTLDGYYEGPGKDVMAIFDYRHDYPTDHSFDAYNAERLRAADTLLLGRTSYEGFKGFWPPIEHDPNATAFQREISRLDNSLEKVVVSDSLTPEETAPWQNTTRIIRRADAHAQIAQLKQQSGNDILVFGSRTLWNDLLAHDLVDELHLMISPVILGAGTPLFDGKPPVSLRFVETRTWDGSALALVKYEARRKESQSG